MFNCQDNYAQTYEELDYSRDLISGAELQDLSDRMGISNNTTRKHIMNIYHKMGVRNRVQIIPALDGCAFFIPGRRNMEVLLWQTGNRQSENSTGSSV